MKAPKPWLSERASLSPDEERALRSARELAPPPGADKRVWGLIAANLPLGGNGPEGGSAGLESGSGGATTLGQGSVTGKLALGGGAIKAAAVGLGLGATVFGGVAMWSHSVTRDTEPPRHLEQLAAPTEAAAAPNSESKEPKPTQNQLRVRERNQSGEPTRTEANAVDAKNPVRVRPPQSSTASTTLPVLAASRDAHEDQAARAPSQESRLVARARAALRSGDASSALRILDDVRDRFPNPILDQEIEALSIEALLALGRNSRAEERARRFLGRYPESPYAASVRKAVVP